MPTVPMTSRERVLRTLNRQPADRFPIDLGVHMSTGISMFAYWNLRESLGLSTDLIQVPDMVQGLAYVDTDILERFHCDCILLEPPFACTRQWNPRGRYRFAIPAAANPQPTAGGGWEVRQGDAVMRMPPGGYFFDGEWLSNWGEGTEEDRLALYAHEARRIFEETDYATNMLGYSHGSGLLAFGAGNIDEAILAYDHPQELHDRREQQLAENLRRMGRIIDAFGPYIQMISLGDDMGSQNGVLCGPDYVEAFCMPYYKRFCAFVHAHSDIKVFLHSCGAVGALMPMIVDAGFDILNPVQISATGMDPQALKAQYGDRICFWGGGCDTQKVLGTGTPAEVAAHVRNLIAILKPNGGFVFNQVHNIMGDVPPENITAMLDTAYAESFYAPVPAPGGAPPPPRGVGI